jgi:imidazolonepropionase-like amidohydrolase
MRRPFARPDRPASVQTGWPGVLLLAAGLLLTGRPALAQSGGGVYAIQGATLVTVSGSAIGNGTIVLRNGLIEAIGRRMDPPTDAVVIDGSGLTVYPGFIDAFSQVGIPRARGDEREYAANIADRLATDKFETDSEDLARYRAQGITSALVARSDGIFAGRAALVNLMGDDVRKMTVKAPVVQVLTYSGQRGYPGTLMAVVAYQRQALYDAAYQELLLERYAANPNGMARPSADPALEALIPVTEQREPILVVVHRENDFVRLENLAEEFGFRFWIAGAEEAFRVPGFLRSARAPVIVSLNFPMIQRVTGYRFERAYRNLSADEKKELDERDQAAVHGNAASVYEAGVPLALSTSGMTVGSFHRNLRTAIKAGLPPDEALKALTLNPARLFGVDQVLGTLEEGKIANLTITRGDYFEDDDAKVAYVFIDGRMESFTSDTPGAGGGSNDER